jgi:phosphoglycerate dehydrogenase-like enzyme
MRERLSERPKEVYGKTLGIIGAGSITNMVIERAEGFGCDILVWTFDPEKHSELKITEQSSNLVWKNSSREAT